MAKPVHHDLIDDLKRLSRYAAVLGMVLAVMCHLVPPQYRAACDAVATVCNFGRE